MSEQTLLISAIACTFILMSLLVLVLVQPFSNGVKSLLKIKRFRAYYAGEFTCHICGKGFTDAEFEAAQTYCEPEITDMVVFLHAGCSPDSNEEN